MTYSSTALPVKTRREIDVFNGDAMGVEEIYSVDLRAHDEAPECQTTMSFRSQLDTGSTQVADLVDGDAIEQASIG